MKYRIKVIPHKGQLLYIPQKSYKCLWWNGWTDIIHPDSMGNYDKDFAMRYICSERACLEWIKLVDDRDREYEERKVFEKKFKKDNPIRYIEVNL